MFPGSDSRTGTLRTCAGFGFRNFAIVWRGCAARCGVETRSEDRLSASDGLLVVGLAKAAPTV